MSLAKINIDARSALSQLDRIATAAQRSDAIRAGVKAGLAPTIAAARAVVRQPGQPGYTPRWGARGRKKLLRDTIGQLTRIYSGAIVGVVGPQSPAGAHGHLVEDGHRIVTGGTVARQGQPKIKWRPGGPGRPPRHILGKRTPSSKRGRTGMGIVSGRSQAFPFMAPAFASTSAQAEATMLNALRSHVEQAVAAGGGANG